MLIGLIIISLYIYSSVGVTDENYGIIPLPALVFAAAAILMGGAVYLSKSVVRITQSAVLCYIFAVAAAMFLVTGTGGIQSPYLVLWVLATVFSGILGIIAVGILLVLVNVYLAMQYFGAEFYSSRDLVMYLITVELPIVASFAIWHSRQGDRNKDRAFSALAEELSHVANKSEIVINAIADGVIALDSKGNIQLINPAAQSILGWEKTDAQNLDYKLVVKLADRSGNEIAQNVNPIARVLATNETIVNNDLLLLTKTGSKKLFVSVLVSPVSTTSNAGAIVVFRDISQQKSQERQQQEFVSTASHEMRTPIAAIEGYISLALNPATATIDDKARVYISKAHESAQHLGALFRDLLDVSRIEDGRLQTKPTVVDITEQVQKVVEESLHLATEKGLQLTFGGAAASQQSPGLLNPVKKLTPVYYSYVDPDRFREVMANLVNNAVKYTKAGSVQVDVTGDPGKVVVSVKDTGIGIPPEDIPHLFQKFYRVDSTDTREIGGTGLGLYLARRLVEVMNGRVWVESKLGEGSTFFVEMPRMSADEAERATKEIQPMAPAAPATPAAPVAQAAPTTPVPPTTSNQPQA